MYRMKAGQSGCWRDSICVLDDIKYYQIGITQITCQCPGKHITCSIPLHASDLVIGRAERDATSTPESDGDEQIKFTINIVRR